MKVLIIRSLADEVDSNTYNLQEVGLAKALVKLGHECDIIYYTKEKNEIYQKILVDSKEIRVIKMPALKIKQFAIFKNFFLMKMWKEYDVIQVSEYFQIMTLLVALFIKKPLVLYHGPYKDDGCNVLGKIYFKIYDLLFLKVLIKRIDLVISKSLLATDYLLKKGFKRINTIGVGLDVDNLNLEYKEEKEIIDKRYLSYKKLLFVGRLEDVKNIKFMFEVFKEVIKKEKNICLIIVGKGKKEKEYREYAEKLKIEEKIIMISKIEQKRMKKIYEIADLLLLPSKAEIFGMVLLESMYFGVPVLSSNTGGASLVIKNNFNGFVLNDFNKVEWSDKIINILSSYSLKGISGLASETIKKNFLWDRLIYQYIETYKEAKKKYYKQS